MKGTATSRGALGRALIVSLAVIGVIALPTTASASLPNTTSPTLKLDRTIRTTPFVNNSSVSVRDMEGSAYVPSDGSIWLADDNGRSIYEVDPITGSLKRVIGRSSFEATRQFSSSTQTGSGSTAGSNRGGDLESMAYDARTDTLYAFSGKCCNSSALPTAFRLKRTNGVFQLESYQPLASGSDFTGAAWNPTDGRLYVGVSSSVRSYDYVTNTPGSSSSISGVSSIYGMSFSDDGADLFVVGKSTKLYRVTWATKSVRSGWTFDLSSFGLKDTRAVELIGDRFYVLDGYDHRSSSDPLNHAVFVLSVVGSTTSPPTASFTPSTTSGSAPLSVTFTDTSTGGATSWSWAFGDGGTSTVKSPTHVFNSDGTYTVTLVASNSGGPSAPATTQIHVSTASSSPPTASFNSSTTSGVAPLSVTFTDTSTGGATSWSWTFGDGGTSSQQSPTHVFNTAGTFTVTLVASNTAGPSSPSTKQIQVSQASGTQTITLNPSADTTVSSYSPSKNYGSYTTLTLKLSDIEYLSLLNFTVQGLPAGVSPTSAHLRLYVTDGGPDGGTWFRSPSNWNESTVTWVDAPTIDPSTAFAPTGSVSPGTWIDINVTGIVTGNGTFGFAARTSDSDRVIYTSREGTQPPQLVLTVPT